MAEDPDYVRLFGFPLALQIWFYESCNQVDQNIAVRLRTRTPRMLNWSIDERKIFYEHLKKRMFRDVGNPYKFRNLDFTPDELDAIRQEELGGTKTRSVGRVPLVSGSETRPGQSHGSGDADNREESATDKSHQSVEKLETEIMLVRKQLSDLEAKVDGQFAEMKLFIVDSLKNFLNEINIQRKPESRSDNALSPKNISNEQGRPVNEAPDSSVFDDVVAVKVNISNEQGRPLNEAPGSSVFDDVVADKVIEEICKFYSVDCTQGESSKDFSQGLPCARLHAECTDHPMSLIAGDVTGAAHKTLTLDDFDFTDMRESQIVAIENRLPYITPAQQPRTRAPGKYAQSPYTELMDSAGASGTGTGTVLFQMKHPFVESLSFDGDQKLMESFQAWFKKRLSKKRSRKLSAFTVASNKICPPFDFGVDRVEVMDWFYDLVTTGRPWTDLHVDVIMYYLRKKSKYGPGNEKRVTFTDSFFIRWVEQIFDSWTKNMNNSQLITPDHEVAQYIRGFKIHVNTPWKLIDLVYIPINLPEACHWVLAILSIKSRCLHVFDSLCDVGAKHFAAVNAVAKKLAVIIPLFFISTGFYGKRNDIDWNNASEYIDCAAADPLVYFIADNSPQQSADSNDCGLYTCALAEYISHGHLHIDNDRTPIFPDLFRLRYGALLWDYAVRKIDAGAVSKSEVTGKVTSRRGGPMNSREYIPVSDKVAPSKYVPRRK